MLKIKINAMIGLLLLFTTTVNAASKYRMIELPVLWGGTKSAGFGLNNRGIVVGQSSTAVVGSSRAVYWLTNGSIGELPAPRGICVATTINDANQVVGLVGGTTAVLWNGSTNPRYLSSLGGGPAIAYGINASGQIIGTAAEKNGQTYAVLWTKGRIRRLGVLPRYKNSTAMGINDKGRIVGASFGPGGKKRAFLYEKSRMKDLGTLSGGRLSAANAINKKDMVVGWSETLIASAHAFLWKKGRMIDLGTLGGRRSSANDINDKGQVVGKSFTTLFEDAFIWEDDNRNGISDPGEMKDLNDLVVNPSPDGGRLKEAVAINNTGQIVATLTRWGVIEEKTRAVLLIPLH